MRSAAPSPTGDEAIQRDNEEQSERGKQGRLGIPAKQAEASPRSPQPSPTGIIWPTLVRVLRPLRATHILLAESLQQELRHRKSNSNSPFCLMIPVTEVIQL